MNTENPAALAVEQALEDSGDPLAELRNAPVQFRAQKTLDKLEQAALRAIAEHGRDNFTTAMMADGAGVSIGTVYRYFPNRKAVLKHLFPDMVEGLGEPRIRLRSEA